MEDKRYQRYRKLCVNAKFTEEEIQKYSKRFCNTELNQTKKNFYNNDGSYNAAKYREYKYEQLREKRIEIITCDICHCEIKRCSMVLHRKSKGHIRNVEYKKLKTQLKEKQKELHKLNYEKYEKTKSDVDDSEEYIEEYI